jgi:hypothetical protein
MRLARITLCCSLLHSSICSMHRIIAFTVVIDNTSCSQLSLELDAVMYC